MELDQMAAMNITFEATVVRQITITLDIENFDISVEQQKDPDIKPVYEAMKRSSDMPEWSSFHKFSEDTRN